MACLLFLSALILILSPSLSVALEESLEVGGYGYPALVAVAAKKNRIASMKGVFVLHESMRPHRWNSAVCVCV